MGHWPKTAIGVFVAAAVTALAPVAADVTKEQVQASVSLLPRGFVANRGQWDPQAAWSAPGFFGTTWVTRDGELRHVLLQAEECDPATESSEARLLPRREKPCPTRSWVLAERFVGGKVRHMQGKEPLGTQVSYFLGRDPSKHRSGLESFGRVSLGEVWPGVEVSLQAGQKTVEKIFTVSPFADPSRIRVGLAGAETFSLNDQGELVVSTGYGDVVFSKPVAWQEAGGGRTPVEVSYRLDEKTQTYGFALGAYDNEKPLIIDPILQATYLGGSGNDEALALALAGTGEVYVAGRTAWTNFPRTTGGAQPNAGGARDAFVARLDSSLRNLIRATYLGGSGDDQALALGLAPNGDVYVAGVTESPNFPGTTGGAQPTHGGWEDAFVARLNSSLTTLSQATYLGGSSADAAHALALSGSGEVYVAGWTFSANFPRTTGGAQATYGGNPDDAFVARLNSSLTSLMQSTYLGGSDNDEAWALALSGSGEVYVAGWTFSFNFPGTAAGAQGTNGGDYDAFVARLNSSLTSLMKSTYLGGSNGDFASALALSGSGEVYVAGETWSDNFPGTAGGAQVTYAGNGDAVVARLDSELKTLKQSTYLGGSAQDEAWALALSGSGKVYVAGWTFSTNFPGTAGGAQATYAGNGDAFAARLGSSLTTLKQATYLGGNHIDRAFALALSGSGKVYVAGGTVSPNFPGTAGGAQASNVGSLDAFVVRLSSGLAATTSADMVASTPSVPPSLAPGGSYPLSFSCTNDGPNAAANARCSIAASAGTVSGVSCSPSVPVASLTAPATITCTYTFTPPGSQGGGDTPETGVTFSVTASSATSDPNSTNNTATSGATPIPIVDASSDAVTLPAGTVGATFNVGSNDQ